MQKTVTVFVLKSTIFSRQKNWEHLFYFDHAVTISSSLYYCMCVFVSAFKCHQKRFTLREGLEYCSPAQSQQHWHLLPWLSKTVLSSHFDAVCIMFRALQWQLSFLYTHTLERSFKCVLTKSILWPSSFFVHNMHFYSGCFFIFIYLAENVLPYFT